MADPNGGGFWRGGSGGRQRRRQQAVRGGGGDDAGGRLWVAGRDEVERGGGGRLIKASRGGCLGKGARRRSPSRTPRGVRRRHDAGGAEAVA